MPSGIYERRAIGVPKPPPSIPSKHRFCEEVKDEKTAIEYLKGCGVLPNPKDIECQACGHKGFRCKSKSQPKQLKCNGTISKNKKCGKTRSILEGTFFANSRLKLNVVLCLALDWLKKTPATQVIDEYGLSSATVTDYYGYFRQHFGETVTDEERLLMDSSQSAKFTECVFNLQRQHRS